MAFDFGPLNDAVTSIYGQTVTHIPNAGPNQELQATLLDPARLGEVSPGVLLVAAAPPLHFVTQPAKGDQIQIGSVEYRVFAISTDAGGMAQLSLTL